MRLNKIEVVNINQSIHSLRSFSFKIMFKNLIKKVREESHNASILPETDADETHEQLTKDQSESDDNGELIEIIFIINNVIRLDNNENALISILFSSIEFDIKPKIRIRKRTNRKTCF